MVGDYTGGVASSGTEVDDLLLHALEPSLCDMDDLEFATLAQHMLDTGEGDDAFLNICSGSMTQQAPQMIGRRRSHSFAMLDESSAQAVSHTEPERPKKGRKSACTAEDGDDRVERKKVREKKRRLEVNEKFDELIELIGTVESGLGMNTGGNASGGSRAEVLARAVRVMRRLWSERSITAPACGQRLAPSVDQSSAPKVPMCPPAMGAGGFDMARAMAMLQQPEFLQQQQKANDGSACTGKNNFQMPMVMLMPMFYGAGGMQPGNKPPTTVPSVATNVMPVPSAPAFKPNPAIAAGMPKTLVGMDGKAHLMHPSFLNGVPFAPPAPPAFVREAEEEQEDTYAVCA